MSDYKPWADRLREEIDAFFRLWKERKWYAIVFIAFTLGTGIYFVVESIHKGTTIDSLQAESKELKRDLRQLESENRSLRETVAPLIARAAKEFPGEEINTSLKKILDRLEKENPLQKPIAMATAEVEISIKSDAQVNTRFMDQGGYAALCRGASTLLITSATESMARQTGRGEVVYRGEFKMRADDFAVGMPIKFIKGAEYLQIEFNAMPEDSAVVSGKAIFVVNNSTRLAFSIPQQQSDKKKVFVRNLADELISLTQ
jgi:hypothetical protein